jgi:hypothetical protein
LRIPSSTSLHEPTETKLSVSLCVPLSLDKLSLFFLNSRLLLF